MKWYEALDLPGAWDMLHLRRLMESRPMLHRYPDQSIIWGDAGGSSDRIAATQGDGYAFIYIPCQPLVIIDFSRIEGQEFKVWWYNPRTGESTFIREVEGEPRKVFRCPVNGVDWVLVIDDASRNFPEPGK